MRWTAAPIFFEPKISPKNSLAKPIKMAVFRLIFFGFWIAFPGLLIAQGGRFFFTKMVKLGGAEILFTQQHSFFQDRQGFLWIVTGNGLFRFDGNDAEQIGGDLGDTNALSSPRVRALQADDFGNFWITTFDRGLNFYERETGKFSHFAHEPADETTLTSDELTTLKWDNSGKLWIGSNRGLNFFDPKTGKNMRFLPQFGSPGKLQGSFCTPIATTPERIYVVSDRGLEFLDRATGQWHFFETKDKNGDPAPLGTFSAICDHTGRIWMGHPQLPGLRIFDPATGKIQPSGLLENVRTGNMLEDRQHQIWVCAGPKLYRISPDRATVEQVADISDLPGGYEGVDGGSFLRLFEDRQGLIWVATNAKRSVHFFDPQQEIFKKTALPFLEKPTDTGSILFDEDGTGWINSEKGLCHFDPKTGKQRFFDVHDIYKIAHGKKGELLLSTEEGLFSFSKKTDRVTEIKLRTTARSPMIVLDARFDHDGDLWAATWDEGLVLVKKNDLDQATGAVKNFTQWKVGSANPFPDNKLQRLLVARDNSIWVTGYTLGLCCVDKKTGAFKQFNVKKGDKNGLSSNYTQWILEDARGDIWISTPLAGHLNRFSRKTGKFQRFHAANGLPEDMFMSIALGLKNDVWINHRKGLFRLDAATDSVFSFSSNHDFGCGLGPVAVHPLTGEIYFNSQTGIRHFSPSEFEQLPKSPVGITMVGVSKFDPKTKEMQAIQPGFWKNGAISLAHSENTLELKFTILDLRDPAIYQFSYSLVEPGDPPNWVNIGNRHSIELAQLAPGDYVFSLKGGNQNGQQAVLSEALRITVRPPWWQTWQAILVYLALLAAIAWRINRYLLDRQAERHQKKLLQQSLSQKEALFKEVHHRVKNNLQIISGLLQRQGSSVSDPAAKRLLKDAEDRVFSMALVHQNLYENENLGAVNLRSYFQLLTKNIQSSQVGLHQKIAVKLDVDDSTVDIDTAIPLGLILNELMTNCLKYAFSGRESGQIDIVFRKNAANYSLQVRDDGNGLPAGFEVGQSKSLGLVLVRGLARQLGGQLLVEASAAGSSFTVEFAEVKKGR